MTRFHYRSKLQRILAYTRFAQCKIYHRSRLRGAWNSSLDRRCTLAIAGNDAWMTIDAKCLIAENCFLYSGGELSIGHHCFLNANVRIVSHCRIRIGAHCMLGPYSSIVDQDHVVDFNQGESQRHLFQTGPVTLGDHVWIGEKATILKGVTIGSHSVIGAGAVVTRSIPAWSVAVGCPAKVIRRVEDQA